MVLTSGRTLLYNLNTLSSGVKLSILIFGIFFLGIFGFILFAVLGGLISVNHFMLLFPVLCFYLVLLILLSRYLSSKILRPFRMVEKDIEKMLANPEISLATEAYLNTEYGFLRNLLVNALKLKAEQNILHKKLNDIASEVKHDIASPIFIMNVAISNLKKFNFAQDDLHLLEKSMHNIKNITANLSDRYRSLTTNPSEYTNSSEDDNIPRYIVLSSFINNIIANKQSEWSKYPCKLELEINPACNQCFIYVSPLQLAKAIANLFNNLYDSLNKSNCKITLILTRTEDNFELIIKDKETGISADKLSDILFETQKYFISQNGNLSLQSQQDSGTTISITLPVAKPPLWFFTTISYSYSSVFVILDDDPSVIALWQRLLIKVNVPCMYFLTVEEFNDWFENNNFSNSQIILLIDYKLSNTTTTGIDIIEKFKIVNAYLFSSYAEQPWLQKFALEKSIKLSPKSLINNILIELSPVPEVGVTKN